jgi:hypothetical protein
VTRTIYLSLVTIALIIALTAGFVIRGQKQSKPEGQMNQQHMDEMNKRGDEAMGFDHARTTHHFILESDGGSIQIQPNSPTDNESRNQIRMHLEHIAMMFSDGNFEVPMLIHDEKPPGTEAMKTLKADIKYQYKETEHGAAIRISTNNAEALQAVHLFLRYQIKEHLTGDPLEISTKPN